MGYNLQNTKSQLGGGGGGRVAAAQWANFRDQVEIILGLVSDTHLHLHVVMF